ncbi:hypothetical protein S40293_01174 [Stachybotrys chartarum IBT 40293]|nr:hypothetical protein S40293_01174 [Stachybotrys chartarum IBT 40293]
MATIDTKADQVCMEELEEGGRPKVVIPEKLRQAEGFSENQIQHYEMFALADQEWHHVMTKKLMRKVDLRLLPMLSIMYLLNFLDRNNLSQARLGSLEADLGMTGTDFNLATSILFVGYLLMQLPSNLLLTRFKPALYLSCAMCIWGAISAAQAAVTSFGGLIACRFMLGFAEAPFFPGAIFLMSSWYTRRQLAFRIALFYVGSSLANAFGGLLGAAVLGNLDGTHGIAGWRWLFIIEGVITVGMAIMTAFILPNYPLTTKWLTEEERSYAQWRLMDDTGEADLAGASTIKEGVRLAFTDKKLYLFTLLQHCSLLSQTFQYFFPTIVQSLGYGRIGTLLITAPVWAVVFFVSLLITWSSGRFNDRSYHIMILMCISAVGNAVVTSTTNTPARFFAMFLMPLGAVPSYQIILTWIANSFPRPLVKRSVAISFCNMMGNLANVYGPYMYPATDGPRYIAGGAATGSVALFVAILSFVTRQVLVRSNKKLEEREQFEAAQGITSVQDEDGQDRRATGFRYTL